MKTECIIGAAGTGKSTVLRKRIEDGEKMLLTSTTGISAVNLGPGVTTINSTLGFYDLKSLQQAHSRGQIKHKAIELARKGIKTVVIDEISMLQGEALDLIHNGFAQAEDVLASQRICDLSGESLGACDATGLLLCGDFLQLPPIGDRQADGKIGAAKYAFESRAWNDYEKNGSMTRLSKIWRQDDEKFLKALSLVRQGRGADGAIELQRAGVRFSNEGDEEFDGITLFAVNQQVDGFNARRLAKLPGDTITIPSKRWGKELSEWKNIPECLELKDGCLVMILVNKSGTFEYVNGDLATFKFVYDTPPTDGTTQWQNNVETKRGYRGPIPFVVRRNVSYNDPNEDSLKATYEQTTWGKRMSSIDPSNKVWKALYMEYIDAHSMKGIPYYDPKEKGVVIGEIEYMPLRVAYASTVHKVQGLTLDKVQVNISNYWFGNPSMIYVALSRCRSVEGLRIVGDVGRLSRRIKTDSRVRRWV